MATESLTPDQIKQVLGFQVIGLKDKDILDIMYKENPKEIEQKIKHVQQQNQQHYFEQQITKYYKSQADKKKNITKIEKDNRTTYKIVYTPDNLTPTQEAYYKVYDPQTYIQTDYEQSVQKNKQAQNPNSGLELKLAEQTQDINNAAQKQFNIQYEINQGLQNQQQHGNHHDQMHSNLNPNHHHQNKQKDIESNKVTKQKKKGFMKDQEQKEKLKKEQGLDQYQPEAQLQQNDEANRLYCYCRRLYCEGEIMMGCSICDDNIDVVWFHPNCVDKVHNTNFQKLSKEQLEIVDFTCGFCTKQFDKIDKYDTKKFV